MEGAGKSFEHVSRLFDGVRTEPDRQWTEEHGDDGHSAS